MMLLGAMVLAGAACSPNGTPAGSGGAQPAAATPAPAAVPPAAVAPPAASPAPPEQEPKPAPERTVENAVPAAPPAEPKPSGVTTFEDAASKWFITVERAKELYDAKEVNGRQVIFIDARTFLEFRDDGHIRGAMHYATAYTRGRPQPKVTNYLPGSAIVIYCHGELCTDSVEVGRYFESLKLDIGPVFVLQAGFPAWKAAYPDLVDKGSEVGFD